MKKATRQQTRGHNTTLVLKTIYQHDGISRAEIARITSLTRTTVSDITSKLISTGLATEMGIGSSLGGKPPIQVKLAANSRQMIGIDLSNDLGNGKFHGALVNLRGEVIHRHTLPFQGHREESTVKLVDKMIQDLIDRSSAPILGIGIGTPGPVNTKLGIVRQAIDQKWSNLPLKNLLANRYSIPVHIANNSHVAALAEYTYGDQQLFPNLVLIMVGEGISSGAILNGKIHLGDGFSAGEIGHLAMEKGGIHCSCGNRGCLETFASTHALLHRSREIAHQKTNSALGKAETEGGISLDLLRSLFVSGDPDVKSLVLSAGRYLGIAIANITGVLGVRRVVLAGLPRQFGDAFLDAIWKEMRMRIPPFQADESDVTFSSLGEDIVVRGASALVLRQELEIP